MSGERDPEPGLIERWGTTLRRLAWATVPEERLACLHGFPLGQCSIRCACGETCNRHSPSGICLEVGCKCVEFTAQGGEG